MDVYGQIFSLRFAHPCFNLAQKWSNFYLFCQLTILVTVAYTIWWIRITFQTQPYIQKLFKFGQNVTEKEFKYSSIWMGKDERKYQLLTVRHQLTVNIYVV